MGLMLRVRLASFFAGASVASVAGFYLLYKDYMVAHDALSRQEYDVMVKFHHNKLDNEGGARDGKPSKEVKGLYETLDERYEALNQRITTLENMKNAETASHAEASE